MTDKTPAAGLALRVAGPVLMVVAIILGTWAWQERVYVAVVANAVIFGVLIVLTWINWTSRS